MVNIIVTTRDGDKVTVDADNGTNLMELLRNDDFGVLGTCGGVTSCGSCHIYASDALLAASPDKSEDEQDMLDALADVIEVRDSSRLACQIPVTESMTDAELEIAPQL